MLENTFYDKICQNYQQDLIDNLKKFVSINSAYDENSKSSDHPFGKGVSLALSFIEELARKDGFIVNNYNNMIVEILYGSGEKNITIMAHADVVPAGSGWEKDPFNLYEKDGVLYARGVADDKGPALASYYALKALRDNNLLGNYTVRMLVGGNEESGSLGMEYYFHTLKKVQPTLGFSPDSDFPLIYGEKEIINFEMHIPFKSDIIKSFYGGVAPNSVIERFEVELFDNNSFIRTYKNKIDFEINEKKIIFKGKAAHGSTPWEGSNAALYAIQKLGVVYNIKELKDIYRFFMDPRGEGVNANVTSVDMGSSSLNVGIVSFDDNEIKLVINFRHVETVTSDEIISRINKAVYPYSIKVTSISPLLYYPLDSLLVSTLLDVYQKETGDYESKPQTTGGGTYAKEANNVVAFGMQFPDWDSKMHSCLERCRKKDLYKSMSIYARAIVELGKKINENKI